MGRPPTPNQLLAAARAAGILPAGAELVPRKGLARWRARDLDHVASIWRHPWGDRIDVTVLVQDPVFGPPFERGGVNAGIRLRPAGCDLRPDAVRRTAFHEFAGEAQERLSEVPAIMATDAWHWEHRLERPWPAGTPGAEDLDFLRETIGAAGEAVLDRVDLCELLLREDEVHRGRLWVEQRGLPARVIDALLIARDLGDPRLEAAALAILRSDRMVPATDGRQESMRASVAGWLRQYRTWTGRVITLE